MGSSSISDCYLCGARNDPEATYCVRCSGQLLRLPAVDHDPEYVSIDDIVDDISEDPIVEHIEPSKPKQKARKGTLQDQRLSDALGLSEDVPEADFDEEIDAGLVDTVVTSIPRATPSADIPLIGTRPGAVPQSAMRNSEFGRSTYVLLGLLLLATAWLGYTTLVSNGSDNAPGSIAFTGTSVPPSSTTTTERPRRVWQMNEVDGKFGSAFVRVQLIACPTVEGEQQETANSVGVNVSTHNVVFDGSVLPTADIAWIRSRTGARRLALVERTVDGLYIATSIVATSRNIGVGQGDGEPAFFVSYNTTTNVVTTSEERQDVESQVVVTENGDPHSLEFGGRTIDAESLRSIDTRIERDPEVVVGKDPSTCQSAAALKEVIPETEQQVDAPEAEEPSETEQAE